MNEEQREAQRELRRILALQGFDTIRKAVEAACESEDVAEIHSLISAAHDEADGWWTTLYEAGKAFDLTKDGKVEYNNLHTTHKRKSI